MKVLVIVPLLITVDAPAQEFEQLYDADRVLRREDLLKLALRQVKAGPEVELPDADNEGVIFLDDSEEELPDELGDE